VGVEQEKGKGEECRGGKFGSKWGDRPVSPRNGGARNAGYESNVRVEPSRGQQREVSDTRSGPWKVNRLVTKGRKHKRTENELA